MGFFKLNSVQKNYRHELKKVKGFVDLCDLKKANKK